MISFLRKIRQKLLSQNRLTQYLAYAIGEILLVSIGILIALQVNIWNQNRINSNEEYQYYRQPLEDALEEKTIMEATINYSNQVISHGKSAMAIFENPSDAEQDPLQNLLDFYQASQLQDPYSAESTYTELISSGQINLIQNEKLKTALIRYYEIDWTSSGVFNLENKYRENLRSKMPDVIQTEIRAKCNDIYIKSRNGYQTALPKNCEFSIDYNLAKSVVETLSQDESLKKDLRYLIGNETGKVNDLNIIKIQLNDLIELLQSLVLE